ncbi:chemosensory pili system protein ChpA (sensor histidine kinase/response regulator) [Tamilnaduibacter salinus]|uniref:Chemotaxis protein CheA n=1 Tax=Tamilnaduibacter salinus TaxID=1484056 RepID=A0A2U1CYQ0_9GAMM|nr:Hpt domain-containing protein [Tamilnaduibacter salinus]PVY77618.1 chemosensory pili system protein ChpA (sensor histidine kinase/response regulator) [Tamilnaduibacter salinus]
MANHHDSIALDWVRDEIQDTLNQGQKALEAFVENREDTARLRFCLNHLHQVHGTLKMVELSGAALLTDEMERLAQAILNHTVTTQDEAVDVLMQAILQLPQYLEHLGSSRDDFPMVLLPLLNDLRAARGESLLSDNALFTPDLTPARIDAPAGASARLQDEKVSGHVRKLRQMFQFALAGVVRETDLDSHFDYLQKVLDRLIRLSHRTPREELWRAAAGFVETLRGRHNPVNSAVKQLLRQLDAEIRRLLDEAVDILQQPVPETLLKHLLYYVARANDLDSEPIQDLRQRYRLDEALPSDEQVADARSRTSGPGRQAIHSVVDALNEELARLKDQLDLFVRATDRDASELEELQPGLEQVANTLNVLNLYIPARVINEQIELISELTSGRRDADDGTLMDIAGALLYIESTLAGLDDDYTDSQHDDGADSTTRYSRYELGEANSALLREARNSLEQVKTAIVNFIASQWDVREINHVPGLLHSIRGGLDLIPLEETSDILGSAQRYVTDVLLEGQRVPDWRQLDTLADLFTSIEYYLERLAEGIGENTAILDVARDSLVTLGFPAGEEPTWQEDASAPVPELEEAPQPEPETTGGDADLVDDEILEIFIEEAGEVLETIREFYPRLRQDQDDREALTEVRRAFHTLKGSGRLVGASDIGELAWSVENLLNRVIDRSVALTDEVFELIDTVINRVPDLIDAFRDGRRPEGITPLMEQADALATTRVTDESAEGPDDSEPEPEVTETTVSEIDPTSEAEAVEEPDDTPAVQEGTAEDQSPGADAGDDDLIDDEILEIFIEEADEVLEAIREYLPSLMNQYEDRTALTEVRRAFHTLKGSGRMVEANVIGELAWSIENMLNRVIDGTIFMNDDVASLLQDVVGVIPDLVEDFKHQRSASVDTTPYENRANTLAAGEIPESEPMPEDLTPASDTTPAGPETGPAPAEEDEADEVDPVLLEIFESEAQTHLETLNEFLERVRGQDSAAYNDDLSRALHTLKGSANTAGIQPIARVITPLEKFIKHERAESHRADTDILELLERASRFVEKGLAQLHDSPQATLPGTDDFLAKLDERAGQAISDESASSAESEPAARPDPQLIQLFLSEGLDILLNADSALADWSGEPERRDTPEQLGAELRKLARGAEVAGLTEVSELADLLDRNYAAIQSSDITPDDDFFDVARAGHESLINIMDQVAAGLAPRPDTELLDRLKDSLDGLHQNADAAFSADLAAIDSSFEDDLPPVPETDETDGEADDTTTDADASEAGHTGDTTTDKDEHIPEPPRVDDDQAVEESAAATETPSAEPEAGTTSEGALTDLDPELVEIFLEEAYDLINSTGSALHSWSENPDDRAIAAELQRDVHTLKGGARMAGVDAISDLSHVLEDLFEKVSEGSLSGDDRLHDLLFACHDRLAEMVDQVAASQNCPPAHELVTQVQSWMTGESPATEAPAPEPEPMAEPDESDSPPEPTDDTATEPSPTDTGEPEPADRDEDLIGIFLDEAVEIRDAIRECLDQWREDAEGLTGVTDLQQELHTLKGGARLADMDAVADLAEVWHDRLEDLVAGQADGPTMLSLSDQALSHFNQMITALEDGGTPDPVPELLAAFGGEEPPAGATDDASAGATDEGTVDQPETVDAEVLEIFLEEAGEILDDLENRLAEWRQNPKNSQLNQDIQRSLHTLKGGARLAQLTELGDRSHAFETRLIDLGGNEPDAEAWKAITADHDAITGMVETIRQRYEAAGDGPVTVPHAPDSAEAEAPSEPASAPEKASEPPATDQAPEAAPQQEAAKPTAKDQQKAPANRRQEAGRSQETVRVSAPLLDDLVNLAGETSITRSRLEQQSSDFGHTLDEMAATIERLREQLRRMDIETEAQILFRAEQEHGPDYTEDFDPLEMDRYSSIQQLSRALSESTSDLADLRETLSDRVRDSETLLVQQSRINTELQEGLMKTRMIPFSSMMPRLRRIVRQISGELDKQVTFDVRNAEGEMDRSILERMIAPLEHMLRNAVDHGIEEPDERRTAGKPETGEITLSLTREGGEVVLRLIDDGGGIDSRKVREKAVRQGLMEDHEDLSDREILQFILQPGFSTAAKVTQISGRGVGMDVVASEIKQLGGSLDIDSALGKGTTFTVRLPFTVSVNRALMVSTGEDYYAIPLNTIEGIVRVSTYELEEYYKPNAPLYEYAGQEYRLQYLGSLLHSDHHPKLQGQALPLPVILVRGAEQPMALQVDSIMGSREIVVKSLGPQFTSVRGVSGATLLGDGNVVVILDLPAMIRSDILSERQRAAAVPDTLESHSREDQPTLVMVVDDSVTVRKVTGRLLERNGMDVMTAKDGLDAVAQLQDHRPDIVLLDIEMPRMDGFEVASFIRHDEALSDTPICMITSRTGQKHRERAEGIGVNEYLGKPFQETELLNTIERLTGPGE